MTRWERWSFNGLNVVVATTGIVYFWMKYLLKNDDPFAVINHSWQPFVLSAHLVSAPFIILVFGIVFRSHILSKLVSRNQPNQRTGWVSLISFATMALSGYLIQVVNSSSWFNAAIVLHVATSIVFVVGYTLHLVIGWRVLKSTTALIATPSQDSLPVNSRLPL